MDFAFSLCFNVTPQEPNERDEILFVLATVWAILIVTPIFFTGQKGRNASERGN
jgi:hypothetical protein